MRRFAFFSAAVLSVSGICLGLIADDSATPKAAVAPDGVIVPGAPKPAAKTAKADAAKPDAKAEKPAGKAAQAGDSEGDKEPTNQEPDVPVKYSADETAIREAHAGLVKAYASDDAKSVVEHFTADGEYVNARGAVFHGRDAMLESLTAFFEAHPGCQVASELHEVRFVSPTVAVVEGTTTVTHQEDSVDTECNFTAIYNKSEEKWLLASIRDALITDKPRHEDQLEQLNWMIGEWIDEDDDSVVSFSCHPTDNGKFLIRDFALRIRGQEVLSGTQRIGWDPLTGKLRAWIFDSEGGFADGIWHREGDNWILKSAGVTAEGEVASGTSIYKVVNDHMMTWQAVDHQIDGVALPDSPEFTLVHRSPQPIDHDEKAAK